MKIKSKPQGRKKNLPLILGLALASLMIVYALVAFSFRLPPFTASEKESSVSPAGQYVNMDRTKAEKDASKALEENPEQKVQNNQTDTPTEPSTSSNGKQSVNVLLTNSGVFNGTVSASGVVTNIVENAGSCKYVFTNGSTVVTKEVQTLTNPTSTTCETVSFPVSELKKDGTWTVQLKYSSASSEGASNTKEFEI
ncbi:MAG: hypothetical protein WBP12_04115 [Candidatus Saccharimonas sp.]